RIAASLLILLGLAAWFWPFSVQRRSDTAGDLPAAHEIPDRHPGTNRAVLTLSDGKQVELGDGDGLLQDGEVLIHKRDGVLTYASSGIIAMNTMTTPRGGQYQI